MLKLKERMKSSKFVVVVVVVAILWSLGQSQTFPYVSFMGQTLVNHSYVDLSLVRRDINGSGSLVRNGSNNSSEIVQCHTDMKNCCSSAQGSYRGDWYFPNGTRLPFPGDGEIFESRGAQRVYLRYKSGISPSGIYRCDIPTNAVHHTSNNSVRDTVYVGLYQFYQGS